MYAFRDPIINGGKPTIINYFRDHYKGRSIRNANGQVKIYFFVNSEGKAGKFRIQTCPIDSKQANLPYSINAHLFCLTREIRGWEPLEYLGKRYGYYCYLNFKIIDGQINEITP